MSGGHGNPGVEWHEARRVAYGVASAAETALVGLAEAIGLVLADDMVAQQPIPHFASSAMDGWAVVGPGPWTIAGRNALASGHAWPVVTGQHLPDGVRGVLRSEHGAVEGGELTINALARDHEPSAGQHVRSPATEAARGDVVVQAGCIINPAHVALAAACALDALTVHPRPKVAILTTGDEVTATGTPAPGKVRDSFGPQLPAVIAMLGGLAVSTTTIGDDEDASVAAISAAAAHAHVVLTTGGTGDSSADHLRAALARLGATITIPALALRPGGPTMLAQLPGGQFVVCLAGNPLAAFMGLLSVGAPLIAALAGRPVASLHQIELATDVAGTPSATRLEPYSLTEGLATPTDWNGSAMMRGLASAHGVLVIPPGGATAGRILEALSLPWAT
ncbi:MAG: molybdopterin molybdotransferase MoeA [Rhodoglobus sp.]